MSNLYPFQQTVASGAEPDAVVEQIDIGGPAMVRAAAKNHANVAVVVSPARYGDIVDALANGGTSLAERRALALEAFRHTASYDVGGRHLDGQRARARRRGDRVPRVGGRDLDPQRAAALRRELAPARGPLRQPARGGDRAGDPARRQGDVVQQLRRRGCRGAGRVRPRAARRSRSSSTRTRAASRPRRRSPRRTRSRTRAIRCRRTAA